MVDCPVTIESMVQAIGMSHRPAFYSSRGATLTDLNDVLLEGLYQHIIGVFGQPAADAYAQMVARVPVLSATAFLLSLYDLERKHWDINACEPSTQNFHLEDHEDGWGAIAGAVVGLHHGSGDTARIRAQFLKRHGIPIPSTDERAGYGRSNCFSRDDQYKKGYR